MKDHSPGYETAAPFAYTQLREHSKNHRREPTVAEIRLWECLRAKRLGVKFRRQHVIGDFIVDFVCLNEMLVIEVDGGYHNDPQQQEDDRLRTEELKRLGYRELRFTNDEVIYNIYNVLDTIRNAFVFSDLE